MKTIFIALLIFTGALAQNNNFTFENNLITWKLIFEDTLSISELKHNPSIEFVSDSTGLIKMQYFYAVEFAEFKIEPNKNKYCVSVCNFIYFDDISHTNAGWITNTPFPIEIEFNLYTGMPRINSTKFDSSKFKELNRTLIELFTIKNTTKSEHYKPK